MPVGLRRNPFGAQALFGYDEEYEAPKTPAQQQFLGLNDVAGVGLDQTAVEPTALVEPVAAAEMVTDESAEQGSGDIITEAMIEQRRRLAKALMGNQQEVNHPMQAIGNAVSQISGAYLDSKAARDASEREKSQREALRSAIGDDNDIDGMIGRLLKSADPALVDKGLELRMQQVKAAQRGGDKPDIETFYEGDESVQKQWNPETRKWEEMGRGKRWRASGSGDGDGPGGGGTKYQQVEMQLPDGRVVLASYNPRDGKPYYQDEKGNLIPVPPNARPATPSTGGMQSPAGWLKLKKERQEGINALSAIDAYSKQAGGLKQGYSRWATEIGAKWKTFLGQQGLSQEQFDQLEAPMKQQALLGMLRTTIVGPGVMTEYDAQRIIQAMGGDPRSALQNPEVLSSILEDLYERKRREVQVLDDEYRRVAPTFGEEPQPIPLPQSFGDKGKAPGQKRPARDPENPYKPGDIVKGYRFKGKGTNGDWRDKRNYEKVAP